MSSSHKSAVQLYVVLSNKSSKQNLGTYLRTASAFGATQVIVVGSQRFGTHGAHRAQKYVDVVHFYEFTEARNYLKSKDCTIFGVKMQEGSSAAHTASFEGTSAFVIGNEFPDLSEEQIAICDHFIHVPFHGPQVAAITLDTTVTTAILLHNFTKWAQFPVRSIEATNTQGKFVLDNYPVFNPHDNKNIQKATEREEKRAKANDGFTGEDDLSAMFE